MPDVILDGIRFVSVLFAVFAVLVLWRSAERPVAAMWGISALLVSYLLIWIIAFSGTTGELTAMVARISYLALLADATGTLIGPVTGVVIIYLDTAYAAGLFGHAFAEHPQRTGAERAAAAAAVLYTPYDRSEEEENLARGGKACITCLSGLLSTSRWPKPSSRRRSTR